MTPAIKLLKQLSIPFTLHEYFHNPNATSYGTEAAEALGVPAEQVFKTLVTQAKGKQRFFAVAMVPVDGQLSLRKLASALKIKKIEMASPLDAQRVTGYVIGGICPLGQRERLPLVVDESALSFETIYFSGGRRGLELEICPKDLLKVTGANTAGITMLKPFI